MLYYGSSDKEFGITTSRNLSAVIPAKAGIQFLFLNVYIWWLQRRLRQNCTLLPDAELNRVLSVFVLSQILAGVAFACGLASFQFKSRRSVLLCLTLLTTFNASHFFLLGRIAPAALTMLTGIRYVTAVLTRNRTVMVLFMILSVGVFWGTFKSPLSFLALLGVLLGTYGTFQPADRKLRLFLMLGNACWLIHNLLAGTPVATVMEASFLTSNITGYWRFYRAGREPVRS